MKSIAFLSRVAWGVALLILLQAGCASTPKIDWDARVGSYSFDQAVAELGPPDKQARLTDGTLVAEWQTQRGYTHTYYQPYYGYRGYYGGYYRGYYAMPVTTWAPDAFLRLTFDAAGHLTAWK